MKEPSTHTSILHPDGDGELFAEVYRPFAYSLARQRGCRHEDAENVAQNVVTQLWLGRSTFQRDRSKRFRGYVNKIVGRRMSDEFRPRRPTVPAEALDGRPAETDSPELPVDREWEKAKLLAAFEIVRAQVEPSTAMSFALRCLKEWPTDKVCESLGITPDQVYQNKKRMIQRLRDLCSKNLGLDEREVQHNKEQVLGWINAFCDQAEDERDKD